SPRTSTTPSSSPTTSRPGSPSTRCPPAPRPCGAATGRSSRPVAERARDHDRATRRLWPALALPGTFWLIALFLVPFYAVMAVAFSGLINVFGEPIPAWNPLDWQFDTFTQVLTASVTA